MAKTKNNTTINTSVRSTMYKKGRKSAITKICIHHWGSLGQRHDDVVSYLSKQRKVNPTSAHYVVSSGRINEIVDPKNTAWHAANGNSYTIGIECRPEMSDGDFETVAQLIAYLRSIYGNLPLVGHKDILATECPGKWYNKLSALSKRANEINNGKASSTPVKTSTSVWETSARIKGMSSTEVKSLQTKLVKAGYSVGKSGVDGSYKNDTVNAVKQFQKKNGLSVDGVAGPSTMAKLNAVIKGSTTKPSSTNVYEVSATVLNYRQGAGTNYKVNGTVKKGERYTITQVKNGWGKLKSGAGWVSMKYMKKVA